MRRNLVLAAIMGLTAAAIGTYAYRAHKVQEQERRYISRIGSLSDRRASQEAVESEIGPPQLKEKRAECPEGWTYRVGSDRVVVLCFDDSGRAKSATVVRSFSRRDF